MHQPGHVLSGSQIPRDMAATIDVVMMLATHLANGQTESIDVYRAATLVRGFCCTAGGDIGSCSL